MQLYFRQIGLLKLMIGEEPRPSDPVLQEDWDERSSAGYYLKSQSLELNQRHHVMHLLLKVECGPKAWIVLKELHAPTSVVATLMLKRELRLSEGEPNRHQDGGARRNQKNGASMVADSSNNNPKSNSGAEKKERTAGQFFHIGEQGELGDVSPKVGAEMHLLDYWVLDTGAAWTMTPRKDLLDHVRATLINEVCSASRHALSVAGAGRAAFKGADGKPVVLHDVLLVPELKANLISLCKLGKSGVSTDGARTYKGQLGNRVLWDRHESTDVYRSMWQLPALAWQGGGQAGEGSASQGECNAVGGVGVKVSARSGETDWGMWKCPC
ncbi:unnamed protein product [Closterium sp. NIES-65]|nr:unnamed protein product [Closterium sp. NIES-65]